jgi:hypothetical protein
MPFNELERARIERFVGGFCAGRIPEHLKSQIKVFYTVRGNEVKIIESRPTLRSSHLWAETPIARLQYDPQTLEWQLFWMRAPGKWQKCPDRTPTNRLQSLIDDLKEDRFGVFWG